MTDYLQVITTTANKDDAQQLANALIERRLAACVQIVGPVTSTYHWKGGVENDEEWQCLIKTRRDLFDRLESALAELHPYEVPEILATPVVAGSKPYLDWMQQELDRPGKPAE